MSSKSSTESISQAHHGTRQDMQETTARWWILIAIGIGTFMSALDGSVVNTVLPVVTKVLNSNIAATEWVVTVYLLVLSGLLLSFGRLGDIQGHKRVYMLGFSIFLVSSGFCGLAPSVPFLIAFRAVQALGAAMLSANSPAILTKSFPARQRGQALGLQATMTYLGLTIGPSFGGWLADQFSWRAVFYINVPVGLVAILLSSRYIPSDRPEKISERFDTLGAAVLMVGLIALLFGLNQGHAMGWLSPVILASLFAAVGLLIFFTWIEKKIADPMLDLSLFYDRVFSNSVVSAVINYICVYTITFLMPFYLILGRSFSPTRAGLILTAMPLAMAVVAPLSGSISDKIGTRLPAILGMLVLAFGLYTLSSLGPQTPPVQVALRLAITGLGIGTFISPNTSALMGAAPHSRQGIAAGVLATSRNFGMVLGVGLAGAIFTTLMGHSADPQTTSLFNALRVSFITAAAIALAGFGVSIIRPDKTNPEP